MSHSEGTSVPKFGSFRPRPSNRTSTADSKHEPWSERCQRNRDELPPRKRISDDSLRSRHRKERSVKSSHQHTRTDSPKQLPKDPESFMVDLRGDPKNVEYGCLHRYSIPLFHSSGRGSVIGAPPNVKIDRDASTEKQVVLRGVDGTKEDRRVLSSAKANFVIEEPFEIFREQGGQADTELDFLSLKRKRSLNEDNPSNEVGAGIWSFIEATESSDGEEA